MGTKKKSKSNMKVMTINVNNYNSVISSIAIVSRPSGIFDYRESYKYENCSTINDNVENDEVK